VFLHHAESPTGLFLFGVSCFFKVNHQMLLVTPYGKKTQPSDNCRILGGAIGVR